MLDHASRFQVHEASCYKYTRGAMRTLYLAFVRRIAKWKLLSFRVDEEKRDFSVAADCRTGRIFHYLRHLEDIFRPGRGFSAVKSCLPGARQEGFYPIPVVKIPPMK